MVHGLDSPLQNAYPAAGIIGGIGQHFGEEALGHVVGARTSNKDAARAKQPHGPVIDFFVAAEGASETFLIFGESGWIQDDCIVLSALLVSFSQEIKNIGLDTFYVAETVPLSVGSGKLDGGSGNIDRLHAVAQVTDMNRKTTHVAEGIEGPAPRVTAGGAAVIALVQVGARLLAGGHGDGDLPPIFIEGDGLGERFANEFLLEFQAFEFPHLDIISKEDGAWLIPLVENGRHEGLDPVRGLDEALDNKPVVVAIDDQSG